MGSDPEVRGEVERLVERAGRGSAEAAEELLPRVYAELRALAQARMAQLGAGQTIQATELVHEAYLRMVRSGDPGWDGRAHFFGAAAHAMRDVLVDRARARGSLKRGGGRRPLSEEALTAITMHGPSESFLDLDAALRRLEAEDPRKAKVVTLRFFGGLEMAEIAAVVGVSKPTVERDWRYARAWLRREMEGAPP